MVRNLLLSSMPTKAFSRLEPHLERTELPRGTAIELPGKPIRYAHFFDEGFVSIFIRVQGRSTEVGVIGREGMLGLPAVLGAEMSDYRAVVVEEARVRRIPIETLRKLMRDERALWAIMLRFIQAGVAQIAHTSFANAQLTMTQRLARWLLMAHDRIDGDTVRVTHAALSEALGVQRSGITLALHDLDDEQAIRTLSRAVQIVDREKLAEKTMGSYGPAERAYSLLLGSEISKSAGTRELAELT
jgi:CRP-like cAMP-binding protein